MNPEMFFDNFGLLADTPNGVQKLRELILQLAVQGKLVPQDPNDEPASVLLEKMKTEKARLVKEKKIRKPKKLPGISEDEKLFDLPICWEWSRLNDLGIIFNGNSVNSHKKMIYSKVNEGMPYIATKNVGYGSLDIGYDNGIKIPFGEEKFKVAHANSILICSEGGSAGKKIGIIDRDICFGNKLFANETFNGVLPKYVFYLYQSRFFRSSFNEKMTGIIGGISLFNFLSLVVPLPPLNEQKRIVAKVDQLMALCDELEAQQQKKQEARLHLNSAALDKVLTAHEPDVFAHHWQRICDNFDLLYDTPENVGELRKAILQLAVQGKLVPQDANDEPAAVLLERIKVEKERLVKEGKIKKSKNILAINSQEMPLNLPNGWEWACFDSLLVFGPTNGYSPKAVEYATKVMSLTLSATTSGKFDGRHSKYLDIEIDKNSDLWLEDSDILIQRGNSLKYVGIAAVYNGPSNMFIYPDLMMKVQVTKYVNVDYIHKILNCNISRNYFQKNATGTSGSMPKINQATLRNLLIPLPPLNEQRRIVARVDQLMTLCDDLESKLNQSQTDGEKLMAAAVHQLVEA